MTGDWVIGVDLGGTKIEIGLISPRNTIAMRVRIPTHPRLGPESLVDRIAHEVGKLSVHLPPGQRIAALGLCSPGPVDYEAGTLLDPPNLAGLHYAPLRRMLSERLGIPARIDHDAKAACLGEFHYGAAGASAASPTSLPEPASAPPPSSTASSCAASTTPPAKSATPRSTSTASSAPAARAAVLRR